MKFSLSTEFKSISKTMFHIAIPIAVSGLVLQAQTLIDTAFLARYSTTLPGGIAVSGSEILSAVGNVFFPYAVTLSFILAISTGTVILVSQHLGADEPLKARHFAMTAIKYNAILSCLFYILWQIFAGRIFTLMGVRQPILTLSASYLRFLSFELLYLGMTTSIGAVFQGAGYTRPEMLAGILRSLLHIVLDYLLIFGNFGFPELGIAGAGIAYSISGLVSAILLLLIFIRSTHLPFIVDLKQLIKIPVKSYVTVLKVGLPVGVEDMLWNLGTLILTVFLNRLSVEAVGVYRLVYQIELTPIYFYIGLARAVTTLVGNRTGERNIPAAQHAAKIGTLYTTAFCFLFTTIFLIGSRLIISIFTSVPHVIDEAAPLLIITAFSLIPRSFNVIYGHAIRGYGDTIWMLATQIFGLVFVLSLSYTLMFPLGLGMYGLFIGVFCDELCRSIINTTRFYRGETSIFHRTPTIRNIAAKTT